MAGAAAALLAVAAGVILFNARARPDPVISARAPTALGQVASQDDPLPDTVPEAPERTREQKRFDRYDKDRDGKITRDEYLMQRRKAYAKLDSNHDGMLSFDEWAAKTTAKFATADGDRSGGMNRTEFATTAPKRKPKRQVNCPPTTAQRDDDA